ncbi:MAG TPA: LicD family protein [Flavitalea sp.]|nr:LicD family protein [Flavitalea sp.]
MFINFDEIFQDNREKVYPRLRQCQEVMLRMLKIVDYLCSAHNIKYFLVGGTLLGSVRHKGFIPWDDDLDLGMTRENYDKFVKFCVPLLPKDIFFQTPESDPAFPVCHQVEAKLRDKYSSLYNPHNREGYHDGIQLDIFVYDRSYIPHNMFIFLLNRTLKFFYKKNGDAKRANALKWIERNSPLPLVYASSFINGRKLVKLGANYIRKKEIEELVKVPFEDMQAYIPAGWDSCLKRQYGNYMQLPSENQRRGHHSSNVGDPFTPCNHKEVLQWKDRKTRDNIEIKEVQNGL